MVGKIKVFFKWLWNQLKDWRTLVIFIVVFLILSSEVWIPYILALIISDAGVKEIINLTRLRRKLNHMKIEELQMELKENNSMLITMRDFDSKKSKKLAMKKYKIKKLNDKINKL